MIKCAFLVVPFLLVLATVFPHSEFTESRSQNAIGKKRFELRVVPFTDLYCFVYKLSSPSADGPDNKEFAPAVEAARQIPFSLTKIQMIPFQFESAAAARNAFATFPESYEIKSGQVIPLRATAVRLAESLMVSEKPFIENVWPQHKLLIEKAIAQVEQTLGPKEQDCFDYVTSHLGMEKADQVVPVYLVAESPLSGVTMWGKDETRGVCLLSVKALQGSDLVVAILHESIHALDLETRGKGNVLVELRDRLLKAGFSANDLVVRHGPHMLVFIQSNETVRRLLDSSYQPYSEGVFIRPALEPLVKVELPIWTSYLDGKISRESALNKMVEAFSKARSNEASPKTKPR